jgi:phenylalanyl-tRNA synthetase beta chain
VGEDFRSWLNLDDTLITLKLTPNRADCLSLQGLAREVGAITGAEVRLPQIDEVAPRIQDTVPVQVAAAEACPRYLARVVRGINAQATTPRWMAERLERSGIRPLLAPVDITNYVLLELGQPMHAFALSRLAGGIEVRLARSGEKLELLDGQVAELAPDMLVIADASGPVALAGIMGGQPTSVERVTVDVMLEAAFFAPAAIAGRARRLGLSTDSSHRFERGVDFGATRQAMERATQLLLDICGGQAGPITEAAAELPVREPITLRLARLTRVAGIEFDADQVARDLAAIGAGVERQDDRLVVTPPSFRFDLAIEEDLIEEAVRLFGYDNIPASRRRRRRACCRRTKRAGRRHPAPDAGRPGLPGSHHLQLRRPGVGDSARPQRPSAAARQPARQPVVGDAHDPVGRPDRDPAQQPQPPAGAGAHFRAGAGLRVACRTADEAGRPGLWRRASRAMGRTVAARRFLRPQGRPGTAVRPCAGCPALRIPPCIRGNAPNCGPMAGHRLDRFPAPAAGAGVRPAGRAGAVRTRQPGARRRGLPRHAALSRFPQVRRDLAFVLDVHTPAGELLAALREAASDRVRSIDVFDDYRGKGMAENQKSLAIRVVMQDTERTLTDQEVDDAVQKLVDSARRQCNASLRA